MSALGLRPEIVVLGCSSGGMAAIARLLAPLPRGFALPIVIAQHRARESDDTLASVLQRTTKLTVREAEDKDPIEPGFAYLAPPDYHLLVEPGAFALSVDDMVAFSRPSIDVLFESAAEAYGRGVIGVLLTGANQDGARGMRRIEEAGGICLAQDPSTAEFPTMPSAAIARVASCGVCTLEDIAVRLARWAAPADAMKFRIRSTP